MIPPASAPGQRWLRREEGAGRLGCLFSLLVLVAAIHVAVNAGPAYLANLGFESDIRSEISRAGANFFEDETLMRHVLDLARRNEVPITRDNVSIQRTGIEVRVCVRYAVPVDLPLGRRLLNFEVRASSLVGRL